MTKLHVVLIVAALTSGLVSCKKESPPTAPATTAPTTAPQVTAPPAATDVVSVANVSLGKALGPDKKVTATTDTFAKGDTIYAVVETTGSGTATVKAKWTYIKGDKTAAVSESTQTIKTTGPAVNEFHVSKPDGWPLGEYQVEILVNDKSAGTKKFTVK
jgi:hypothetical protein